MEGYESQNKVDGHVRRIDSRCEAQVQRMNTVKAEIEKDVIQCTYLIRQRWYVAHN